MVAPGIYREMGLNDAEYLQVEAILGREPSETELGMFAVMWSEHCGYKYSRPVLALFKTYREAQEKGALENAGVVRLDDRLGVVFKMESHNHPSAIEPFQGAATGVGGILRDIFTMGARPVASLNSLRFGPIEGDSPEVARNRYLFEHVVAGIAHYGNCVGVPTVGGEVVFSPCYSGNPLVNAMSVGIVELHAVASARAEGVGNAILYVGSSTGRDGIHGATFASVELGPDSESRRPNVQMGDPFMEKLLIEATLEALAAGGIVGIQDMGAAGLTCATCEMATKGNAGIEIDVLKVPRREAHMSPYEVMLSESQERMLACVRAGSEERVASVYQKWGLSAVVIGRVTEGGMVRVFEGDRLAAEVPARALTEQCPVYQLETEEPPYVREVQAFDPLATPDRWPEGGAPAALRALLQSPTIASKRWVFEQYDSMVQTLTAVGPGSGDAAVLRVRGSDRGIAMVADCNGRYCYLDPFVGGQIAVAEAARNLVCSGARPVAVTDCLNFGNPEKPSGFWQFRRAVEGIAAATEALGTPVVSGNVSFYNETPDTAIYPTPVIGMLGILDDLRHRRSMAFLEEGHPLVLLTAAHDPSGGLGGSEYLEVVHGRVAGVPPAIDLSAEVRLQACLLQAIRDELVASAHDCSDGGLAVCLAECSIPGGLGAAVLLRTADFGGMPADAILFGETQSRVVVSLRGEKQLVAIEKLAEAHGVRAQWIGTVGGDRLRVTLDAESLLDELVGDLSALHEGAIPAIMDTVAP
ncbi:MAG TPA: phosphoribosylformylglycinamidine synthase subunit PurL [Chthonomonadales bacterium]|nr:phosphoribosylformylglycinamidine synthase subunit PurL [Chthonomonadales bacterium]